jgi:DNA repair protein RecN (Recombination protein N)
MLQSLRIKNLAVIEDIEVDFSKGFNVFTGETGAGKSIIIDALGLLTGERTDTDLIRTGAEQMSVEGIFETGSSMEIEQLLKESGIDIDGNRIVIKRELKPDGHSRGLVNGCFATTRLLKLLGFFLIDIHGQHQHQRLLDKANHLTVLDSFAGTDELKEEVGLLFDQMEQIRKQLDGIRQDERLKAQKIDILNFQIRELDDARLEAGEEERLEQEQQILANSEFLFRNASEAYSLLYDEETNIVSRLDQVKKNLSKISDIDPSFAADFEGTETMLYNLKDMAMKLQDFSERAAPDANRLGEVEARLDLIKRLKKKYGSSVAEMIAFHSNAKKELEELTTSEEKEAELEARIDEIRRAYVVKAIELRNKRQEAAPRLVQNVEHQLSMLAMERTKFNISFRPVTTESSFYVGEEQYKAGPSGIDEVEFFIAPNVGEDLRPLSKIASGGELSRFMLALESAFKEKSEGRTLIFDEVDSGIGGRVAEIVGKKLRLLAFNNQIICVTHLPQVAASASEHFFISKSVRFNRTYTTIKKLTYEEKISEIARMLGGLKITDATIQQAREFLEKF